MKVVSFVITKPNKHLFILAFACFATLYAADVFDPVSQPPGYAAPIVLSNVDLEFRDAIDPDPNPGGAKAYRPWFEAGTYQGDLIEYDVDTQGNISTSIDLSTSPPGNTGTNWSARMQLDAMDWDLERKIITANAGTQVPFRWSALSDSQKSTLDPATPTTDPQSPVLNFLRGERINEFPAGTLRTRYSVLGDIMHSNPVFVGEPKRAYAFGNYGTFKINNKNRAPRVYAGANDGMLHAFDAQTGKEVYAFVPSSLIPNLNQLSSNPYVHSYFVDGQLTEADVQIAGTWKTILVGGMGAGGKGYFILDVTNPELSSESANTGNDLKLIAESSGLGDDDQGYSYSRAAVTRLNDGNWYVIYGNGYNSVNGNAVLYLYNINTGGGIKIDTVNGSSATPNGLSSPVLVDEDNNSTADVAYAGDIDGNLWKFDLSDPNPVNWGVSFGGSPLYAGSSTQPITVQPDVSEHPTGVGHLVYFGTGRLLTRPEVNNDYEQAVYAIWDNGTPPVTHDLVTQTLTETNFSAPSGDKRIRTISNNPVDWNINTGWTIPLPVGERVLARARFRAFRLQFISINTLVDGGENWLMEPQYNNGGPPSVPVFNLNEDSVLDDLDKSGADIPGGLHLGTGINSMPVFARVRQGVDALFINNLSPPYDNTCTGLCIGGFAGGHIDVDTDSPMGNELCYSGTCENDNDGLGGNTDGHEHEYDEHHGITYVDLFDIEPRRGLTSLDVRDGSLVTMKQQLNGVEEVLKPDGSAAPVSGSQQFIAVIANADLSPGGTLQIGNKEWNVQEYQDMMVDILQNSKPLTDLDGDSLVFTLDDIKGAGGNGKFRILFDDQAIVEGGLMPTVSECVKGLQDPYNFTKAGGHPAVNTSLNKHITLVPKGVANDPTPAVDGYRWRNGTLVLQLLDATNFTLQDWNFMPSDNSGTVTGGVHAKAYNSPPSKTQGAVLAQGPNQSGLLYEVSMYWHYGDLYEDIRVGNIAPCYGVGAAQWSAAVNIERHGLTLGEYQALLDGLTDTSSIIVDFANANAAVEDCLNDENCNESTLNALLADLAAAITVTEKFEEYVHYRSYVAGGLIPPNKLLSIDQPAVSNSSLSKKQLTPLVDNTQVDNESLINGLNESAGARSWVDLTP